MGSICLLPNGDHQAWENTTCQTRSAKSESIKKSSVGYSRLIGINLLAFGLELCASAGFAYIPPLMLKRGFTDKTLTIILGIGPFISLLLVPALGRWSDRCNSRFGRRRPFMVCLGILMIFSLIIIPFTDEIYECSKGAINSRISLAFGVILLDFSSQALMNPCKALIPDIFITSEDQNSGFTMYSCMLSMGGCFGYFITSINWSRTSFGSYYGGQEKAVFCILAILLLFLLLINISIAKEKPLNKRNCVFLKEVNGFDKNFNDFLYTQGSLNCDKTIVTSNGVSQNSTVAGHSYSAKNVDNCKFSMYVQFVNSSRWLLLDREKLQSFFQNIIKRTRTILSCLLHPLNFILRYSLHQFFIMQPMLFRLFLACLFGWMGIMCHDMYYSDYIGQVIYRGRPHAERESNALLK